MTPAEFFAVARGCNAEAKRIRDQEDAMNAQLIAHVRACAGDENANPEKYMIFMERKPKEAKTEAELERKLMLVGGPVG
jgi:hypothetical protein